MPRKAFSGSRTRRDRKTCCCMLDYGVYYEFIPMEHAEEEQPRAIGAGPGRAGQKLCPRHLDQCRLVALQHWRYCAIHPPQPLPHQNHRPHQALHQCLWRGSGRGKCRSRHHSRLRGNTGASCANFTAAPIYFQEKAARSGHEWLVEFASHPAACQPSRACSMRRCARLTPITMPSASTTSPWPRPWCGRLKPALFMLAAQQRQAGRAAQGAPPVK